MRLAHILVVHSISPDRLFQSIPADVGYWYVHFHGTDPALADAVRALTEARPNSVFYPHFENRGLSRSWNDAIQQGVQDGCDGFLLLNDDLFFYEGCYEAFSEHVKKCMTHPNMALITTMGRETGNGALAEINVQGFSCCVLTAAAIERVGYFDETLRPAYFEDSDYGRRLLHARMGQDCFQPIALEHARSSTGAARRGKEGSIFQDLFRRNRDYYVRKWGGIYGTEKYDTPFGDKTLGLKISEAERACPYPGVVAQDAEV